MVPKVRFEPTRSTVFKTGLSSVGVLRRCWCPQSDSNRHCAAFETAVSCQLDYRGVIRR